MKSHYYIIYFLLLSLLFTSKICKAQDSPSFTELLLGNEVDKLILRGEVKKVYSNNGGNCKATVQIKKLSKGSYLQDSIVIFTGQDGRNPNDGKCLNKGDEVVLFTTFDQRNGHTAFYNDIISIVIPKDSTSVIDSKIKNRLNLLKQYEAFLELKETKTIQFKNLEGIIFAEGLWENGMPNKEWKHYYTNPSEYGKVKSRVIYEAGIIREINSLGNNDIYDAMGRTLSSKRYRIRNGEKRIISEERYEYKENTYIETKKNYSFTHGLISKVSSEIFYEPLFYNPRPVYVGTFLTSHNNGQQVKMKGEYNRGARVGLWETFDKDGNLIKSVTYTKIPKEEKRIVTAYWEEGQIKFRGHLDEHSRRTGKWEKFYKNGQVEEIIFIKKGLTVRKAFNQLGVITSTWELKDGILNGSYKSYDKNDGSVITEGNYLNGNRVGEWKSQPISGLLMINNYNNTGQKHGIQINYFQNGNKQLEANYTDDFLDGQHQLYHVNGKVRVKNHYKKGDLIGPENHYNEHGDLIKQCKYKPGNFAGKKECENFLAKKHPSFPGHSSLPLQKEPTLLTTGKDSISIPELFSTNQFTNIYNNSLWSVKSKYLLKVTVDKNEIKAYSLPWPEVFPFNPETTPYQATYKNDIVSYVFMPGESRRYYPFDLIQFKKNKIIKLNRFTSSALFLNPFYIYDDAESIMTCNGISIINYNLRLKKQTSATLPNPKKSPRLSGLSKHLFKANEEFAFFARRPKNADIVEIGIKEITTDKMNHYLFQIQEMKDQNWVMEKIEFVNNKIFLFGYYSPKFDIRIRGMYELDCSSMTNRYTEWKDLSPPLSSYNSSGLSYSVYFENHKIYLLFNYQYYQLYNRTFNSRRYIIAQIDLTSLTSKTILDEVSGPFRYYFMVKKNIIEYSHKRPEIGKKGVAKFKRILTN